MNTKRVLITCTALAALGLALAASQNGVADSVTTRIDNAIHDLEKVHAPIPHEALHAKALEILRGRTVAKEDSTEDCVAVIGESRCQGDVDAYAKAEACVVFDKAPMHRVNCNK